VLAAAAAALVLAAVAMPRMRWPSGTVIAGGAALGLWALFAWLGPTKLGLDHRGLLDIKAAGDKTALDLALHNGARYPLARLAVYGAAAGALALAACAALRRGRGGEASPAAAG
jgi:hypothetical protein